MARTIQEKVYQALSDHIDTLHQWKNMIESECDSDMDELAKCSRQIERAIEHLEDARSCL